MSVQPLTQSPGERARLPVSIPATPTTAGIDSRLLAVVWRWCWRRPSRPGGQPAGAHRRPHALVREATHGLQHRDPAERIPIPVGQGVAGTVAATGRAMVLASPAGNGGPSRPPPPR